MSDEYYPVEARPVKAYRVSFRDMDVLLNTLAVLNEAFGDVQIATRGSMNDIAIFFSDGEFNYVAGPGDWIILNGPITSVMSAAAFRANYVAEKRNDQ